MWADEAERDEEDVPPLPLGSESEVNGVRTVVRFETTPEGQLLRITRKTKITRKRERVPKAALRRRTLSKFGDCAGQQPGPDFCTLTDHSEVTLDLTPKKQDQAADLTVHVVCRICGDPGHWTLKCPKPRETPDGAGGDQEVKEYVPPWRQAKPEKEKFSVKISNLPPTTSEQDISALCRLAFRCKVVLNSDGEAQVAFGDFKTQELADACVARIHGARYGNMVLDVERARPKPKPKATNKE